MPAGLERARQALRSASAVTVLTGAGVSAESGVPTFRGEGGLWRNFRAEDLATPEAFMRDPKLVWEWYGWRRGLIAPLVPNPGHRAIAAMEGMFRRFLLITQNVDGLHHAAGSRDMVELHGNIWRVRCTRERTVRENREVPLKELPPKCKCGAVLRPDIVWFGESLDEEDLERAADACRGCEVMVVAGTSLVVYPAAGLSAVARQAGAFIIEINIEPTPATASADVHLSGKSGEILPRLIAEQRG